MITLLKYTAQAARRREPTVGQEAVSTRSRKRRSVRSQWFLPRHGRLKTACCLSVRGVATAKQRFDRAVGTAGAPFSKYTKIHPFINEIKSHPAMDFEHTQKPRGLLLIIREKKRLHSALHSTTRIRRHSPIPAIRSVRPRTARRTDARPRPCLSKDTPTAPLPIP